MKRALSVTFGMMMALTVTAQVKLPAYSREVLANGTVVLLMPRAGVPLVHFRILVKGGVESQPPELAGIADVTAQLLRRGTQKRTADRFSEELDALGGTFAAGLDGAQAAATAISAEFLKKDMQHGLDLVADAVLTPTFPDDEVRREVARLVDATKSMRDRPPAAIRAYFARAFFGAAHPYGNPADERTLARITRNDIVAYHRRLYCGKNLIVAVTGDFDTAIAREQIAQAFAVAPAGTAYPWAAAPQPKRRATVLLVDKPDATQTYFLIGQPGIDRTNPDRTKIELVNTLFGGRFTSMLNDELRVNSGLTYGARSDVEEARLTGAIVINTYTKVDTTTRAVDLALDLLKRLNEKGISAEQLASAKAYLKGIYPTRHLETIDQLADTLTELELYRLGHDEVDGFYARIDAVTLDEANAVAKKYYRSDDLTVVLLGPGGKIRESVKKYGARPSEVSIQDAGWGQ